ncbi:MAG: hypothetical protein COZ06_35325 [Armatimonadetes bacterium CG_4_10_14_3_um_filter_66_18]|nr:hypothetical protein [Armatimonadota bacterium]OIO92221.1 MAG: hypothetical protein AUJ96_32755 [Armatimonadetes bacterium CG2_30_66_41]PIU87931.1 MAG: hypothetical protein COS65_32150 [Armatimonadetes bacterium CG06_land_8_20_14_3_00_66_21]PIX45017.1 MAG: hypothetical protein COZ57_16505 [Armatimonadetes bacterium CG_4_8_14_3_um_filter_66_20]PIY36673.1 MAG: hypothetical protein COZ06_35325 [Armatimonadetes bacterium CG_4_10_14_3_um_filter_66_18]PIZ33531.1 MAG: hypothetical protein COY42_29
MKGEFLEGVLIFLGILVLWPKYILQWPDPIWEYLAYLTLVLLFGVFVRRVKRFRDAARERAAGGKRPQV